MSEYLHSETNHTSEEAMLIHSCELYQEIERLYQVINMTVSKASPLALNQATLQLDQLVQKAKEVDSKLTALFLTTTEISEPLSSLLKQREETLQRLVNQNRSITQKACTMASHLRHEMGSMKNNRTAMKGYAAQGQTRKNMINSSF